MWLLLAFLSATLLGFYDVFKKKSLKDNAVLPVLFLNTFFSSLIFLPFILFSIYQPNLLDGTIFNVPVAGWEQHKYIIIKSFIVLMIGRPAPTFVSNKNLMSRWRAVSFSLV